MTTSNFFPPVNLVDFAVQAHPRFSGMREVEPLVDRAPYGDWCAMFYAECETEPGIEWKTAGFAFCNDDAVEVAKEHLQAITDRTNRRFAEFLSTAEPRQAAVELLELENINAASVRAVEVYRIHWPR